MLTAHGLVKGESTEEEAKGRCGHNLLFGQVDYNCIRSCGQNVIAFDYAQPFTNSSWTQWLTDLGGGDIAKGIKTRLDQIGADGVLIDTPFATPDVWAALGTIDRIRSTIYPKFCMPNFGDGWTWGGGTAASKALYALTDWHLCEVWMDVNNWNMDQWVSRVSTVNRALVDKKKIVLGIYDNGEKNRQKATSMMIDFPGTVFWSYKVTTTEWTFITD